MLIVFFDKNGVVYSEFVPEGQTVNGAFYVDVLKRLKRQVNRVRPELSANWKLHPRQCAISHLFRGYQALDKKWHRNNSTASLQPRTCPSRIFPLPQSETRPQKAPPRVPIGCQKDLQAYSEGCFGW
ncbi:hypothetical protein TNCV_3052411 [Trichonephila clavipes]|nr:hypothetical protein TNCV_3052411 [Trichonephila clavipes]